MQSYLRRSRLPSALDTLGLRVVIFAAAVGWFVYLWGLTVPTLLAGTALGVMGQSALNHFRRLTVDRREEQLRRRLGGEMFLEEMLLAPPRQAHFQSALLLGMRYPLTMERVTDEGMLCRSGGERLLVACIPLPEGAEVGQGAILQVQRACRRHGVERGVACVTGRCTPRLEAWAAEGVVPVRIIPRNVLLEAAGRSAPATDQQLIALQKRRKRPVPSGVRRTVFRRDKAKTYMVYGVGLMVMYLVTGLGYYPVPGCVCLMMGALCRCWPQGREKL